AQGPQGRIEVSVYIGKSDEALGSLGGVDLGQGAGAAQGKQGEWSKY
ncbi:MAG: hypothetical protein ACJAZ8_002753, partial [Planctomycetota bacterium]